jgi:acyl-CoA dehydrogenase
MSILYDEGQRAIADAAQRVLAAHAAKDRLLALLEQTGAHDTAFWTMACEQGWPAIAVPEAHDGLGLGLIELGLVAQAAGAVTPGAPFLTLGHGAAQALVAGDDRDLANAWLPRLASGAAIATIALITVAGPLATPSGVHYVDGVLTGTAPAVTGALAADAVVVWAHDGAGPVLAFAEMAKVTRRAVATFDASRLHADLEFAGTPARVLARGSAAQALALDLLARMAVITAHEQVGGAEALLHIGRDYALTRKAFGQPIGAFQSVKHRLAELYGLVEIARANAIHAAAREGQHDFVLAAADARIAATDAYDTAARDCVQIHGGIGVTWDSGLHLHMRRARSLAIEQGNLLFWEDLLVDHLLAKGAAA